MMTVRKGATRSSNPRGSHDDKIKDEVYRQMFRLEAGRQDADLALAIALLRGVGHLVLRSRSPPTE